MLCLVLPKWASGHNSKTFNYIWILLYLVHSLVIVKWLVIATIFGSRKRLLCLNGFCFSLLAEQKEKMFTVTMFTVLQTNGKVYLLFITLFARVETKPRLWKCNLSLTQVLQTKLSGHSAVWRVNEINFFFLDHW